MKNEVITVKCKNGKLITYLYRNLNLYKDLNKIFNLKHILRRKEKLYDRYFAIYHKDMDFTNSEIIKDNRKKYERI